MVRGNPVSVVGSSGGNSGTGALLHGLGLGTLGTAGGSLLAGLAGLALLREVGSDPDGIEEVDDTGERGEEEEVQEDAAKRIVSQLTKPYVRGTLHLGVEDAGLGLNHTHSAIEGLNGEELTLMVRENGSDLQTKILRVHLSRKVVADTLLLACRDFNAIARGGQVTDDLAFFLKIPQAASDEVHGDGIGLIVGDVDQRLSRTAIDELHAKDLRGRERGLRLYGESWSLCFRRLLGILISKERVHQSIEFFPMSREKNV